MMNGHKTGAEALGLSVEIIGRGALAERRRCDASHAGVPRREDVGISNDNGRESCHTENPRFPDQR